jgi:hypothetical protein
MLFAIAAWYDIVLGAVFGLFFKPIYERFNSTLPNHDAYVQLPALFILIFGIGFLLVSKDPVQNRAIIPLGILMKAAFCLVVFGHLLFGASIPFYIPFAVMDVFFAAWFIAAYSAVRKPA